MGRVSIRASSVNEVGSIEKPPNLAGRGFGYSYPTRLFGKFRPIPLRIPMRPTIVGIPITIGIDPPAIGQTGCSIYVVNPTNAADACLRLYAGEAIERDDVAVPLPDLGLVDVPQGVHVAALNQAGGLAWG